MMERIIHNIENSVCHRWGLENPHTIRVFRVTEKLRKIFKIFS